MKTVLYLIQAGAGLPEIYSCLRKRNFLILSYKEETTDTTIFASNSTWSVGRNLLRKYVMQHKLLYDYYVFLDEDVVFQPNAKLASTYMWVWRIFGSDQNKLVMEQEAGFSSLEASLEFGFPVVTMYFVRPYIKSIKDALTRKLLVTQPTWGRKDSVLQRVPSFDAMLSGFSREIFFGDTIFPYEEKYDPVSIWHSQVILMVKANYYGIEMVQNNQYHMHNIQHSYKYHSGNFDFGTTVLELYNETCKELGVENIYISNEECLPQCIPNTILKSQHKYILAILGIICTFDFWKKLWLKILKKINS